MILWRATRREVVLVMGIRTVFLSFAVFCICMVALAVEIWIYVLTGVGSAKGTSLGALLLVVLMILTGAMGVLVPVVSIIGAVVKKPQGRYFLFLPVPPFVFTGEKKASPGRR